MIVVELTPEEVAKARRGGARRARNVEHCSHDPSNGNGGHFDRHTTGALGEVAVAKWLGVEWNPTCTLERDSWKRGDAGGLEVRTTRHPYGRLLVLPHNSDSRPFVLVRLRRNDQAVLAGWILGSSAKRPEFWKELQPGRPCYVVPPTALNPMRTLPRERRPVV